MIKLPKQEHYINLQMDPLDNQLTTDPIQTGWEVAIEPYSNWQFRCMDNPDRQFGNWLVRTRTMNNSDGPEPWMTLVVRHREELFDIMHNNGGQKEPYILTSMVKCTLELDELDDEYMGFCTHRRMIHDPMFGQISNHCCLSNAFKLELEYNSKIVLVEMKRATGKEIAKHVIRQTTVIPASCVEARCAKLLIIEHRLWQVLKRLEGRNERGQWAIDGFWYWWRLGLKAQNRLYSINKYLFQRFLIWEIPKIVMNFRCARVWAYPPSLHGSNCKRRLRMKWNERNGQRRLRSKWRIVRRFSIQIIAVQYGILLSLQSTTHLITSIWMRQSGFWILIQFTNQ